MEKKKQFFNRMFIPLMLVALIVVASVPAFRSAVYEGDDLKFHLGRIQAIAEGLQAGQFPVRYEQNAWNGYGYVSSIFYGNIFLYIPAALFLLSVPVYRAYNIYLILVNILTVLLGYYSFKKLLNDCYCGLFATIIYTLAGYRLTNLYVRDALGEYTAMAFMPLLVYGIYRIYESKKIVPFVIAVTGLIQSHILTTEMVAILTVVVIVLNAKQLSQIIKPFVVSVLAILGVNLFFILPFIDSYTSMDLNINNNGLTKSIQGSGLYPSQFFGLITKPNGQNTLWSAENEGFLNVGLLVVICIGITALYLITCIAKKTKIDKWIIQLTIIGVIAMWMSSVYFPWDAIYNSGAIGRIVASVQYPWRYVLVVNLVFTITATYSLKNWLKDHSIKAVISVVVFIIAVGTTGLFDYQLSFKTNITDTVARADWADTLYLPYGVAGSQLEDTNILETNDGVIIPVLAYDNVYAVDNRGNIIESKMTDGKLLISLETYNNGYSIKYIEPVLWRVSELVSILSLFLLVILRIKNF